MKNLSAACIFCEDIREERTGQDTIIGILPDNLGVPGFPSVGPKLGVYVRINMDPNNPPKEISGQLKTPWQDEPIAVGHADRALIDSRSKMPSKVICQSRVS